MKSQTHDKSRNEKIDDIKKNINRKDDITSFVFVTVNGKMELSTV